MKTYLIFDGENERMFMADELLIYPSIHTMNIGEIEYRGNDCIKIQFDKSVEIINKQIGRTYSEPINKKRHVINNGILQCKVIPKEQTKEEYEIIYNWICS